MATKDLCLSFPDVKSAAKSDNQYNNLNLSQSYQCVGTDSVQSKCISNKSENSFNATPTSSDCKNYKSFGNDSWNKFDKQQQLSSKPTNHLSIYDSKEEVAKKQCQKKESSALSSSTLSLHIAAYEKNGFEAAAGDDDSEIDNLDKKNVGKPMKNVKQLFGQTSVTASTLPFEIPRQQSDTPQTPEVMQFKASQKLIGNNNHGSAGANSNGWFRLPFIHSASMGRRGGGGGVRSASPKASGPVRSAPRAASPPPSSQQRSFGAPPPPRPAAGGPTPGGNAPPMGPGMHPPPSQGPGLMGQMAATAGGVAIGSAVGHAVGNMFTGGHQTSGPSESAPLQEASPVQTTAYGQQQQPMQLCEVEWRQLVECTQRQNDLAVCQAFQDLFKDCKMRNGIN